MCQKWSCMTNNSHWLRMKATAMAFSFIFFYLFFVFFVSTIFRSIACFRRILLLSINFFFKAITKKKTPRYNVIITFVISHLRKEIFLMEGSKKNKWFTRFTFKRKWIFFYRSMDKTVMMKVINNFMLISNFFLFFCLFFFCLFF